MPTLRLPAGTFRNVFTSERVEAGSVGVSELLVDFAWGTRSMARSASGFDDATGWRDLTLASNFAWLDATSLAPMVCGVSACETRIPLATLGATRAEVKVFARIVTATGADVANQTLPFDAPETPASVRSLLSLVVPE